MTSPSRTAERGSILLLLGLFLIWNWRLASVTALNHQHVVRDDLLALLAWKTLGFAALCLILFALFRSLQKTALGVACALVFWLLGGPLIVAVLSGAALQAMLQLALILAISAAAAYAITHHLDLSSRVAAAFGAVVLGLQMPGLFAVLSMQSIDASLNRLEADLPPPTADETLPHIIYIVPDRYASNANLDAFYDYSNAPFTGALQTRGFHVWDDQVANYPKTFVSLASTLNADYLDPVIERLPANASSYSHLSPLIQDYAARRALQARGYDYTHIGAWWAPTKQNAFADRNFNDESLPFDQLTQVYLEVTPLVFLLARAEAQTTPCEIVDAKTALIREQVQAETPQFIFWHAFVTHDPYIYNPDGSCRDVGEDRYFTEDFGARSAAYLQHIGHFNRLTLDLVEAVFAESSRDVIFVIQSDEGPYPEALVQATEAAGETDYDYLAAPRAALQRKHGVFNAIYLPSGDYAAAQQVNSPVNNFRLIFRELTGAPVPLLPDRAFSFASEAAPYDMEEVSERAQGAE